MNELQIFNNEELGEVQTDSDFTLKNPKCVYVILAKDNTVKVGITSNFKRRMQEIQSTSGKKIVEYYKTDECSNAERIEALVKNEFKDKHILGEWFSCDFEEIRNSVKRSYDKYSCLNFVSKAEYEEKANSAVELFKKILFINKGDGSEFFNCSKLILAYLWAYYTKLEEYGEIEKSRNILDSFNIIRNALLTIPEYYTEDQIKKIQNIDSHFSQIYESKNNFQETMMERWTET